MNQHFIKLASTVAIAIALATTHAMAQNGSNSPYSRYGFGTLNDRAQGFNKAMAGTALGFHDPAEINFQNPASYSAIDSLAMIFDIGVTFQNANFKQGDLKKKRAQHNRRLYKHGIPRMPQLRNVDRPRTLQFRRIQLHQPANNA